MTRGVSGLPSITVDLVVLRSAVGDAVLRPGLTLFGRVTERAGAHGLMLLNGVPVVAQLPDGVPAGARLRLRVAEAGAERVLLQVLAEPDGAAPANAAAAGPVPAPVVTVPLPGGLQAQLRTEPDGSGTGDGRGGGGGAGAVWLRLDSPQLGRLDLRVDALSCAVAVSAGVPADAARAALPELRAALAAATGRPLLVTLHPRQRALDVSA
jgi:hypothetical protein